VNALNTGLTKPFGAADTRALQQSRGADRASTNDDFSLRGETHTLSGLLNFDTDSHIAPQKYTRHRDTGFQP